MVTGTGLGVLNKYKKIFLIIYEVLSTVSDIKKMFTVLLCWKIESMIRIMSDDW